MKFYKFDMFYKSFEFNRQVDYFLYISPNVINYCN